jgi:hypothetical protein
MCSSYYLFLSLDYLCSRGQPGPGLGIEMYEGPWKIKRWIRVSIRARREEVQKGKFGSAAQLIQDGALLR